MPERITLAEYLHGDETTRPRELQYGIVREPPAPSFEHQIVVGRIFGLLERHVRRFRNGQVVVSPVDVVLDAERALVVQPDIVFVSAARLPICHERVWGAPDLAIEVLSPATTYHDRTTKVAWFRRYDVRECWLVDGIARHVDVIDLTASSADAARRFETSQILRSAVLPRLRLRVELMFGF